MPLRRGQIDNEKKHCRKHFLCYRCFGNFYRKYCTTKCFPFFVNELDKSAMIGQRNRVELKIGKDLKALKTETDGTSYNKKQQNSTDVVPHYRIFSVSSLRRRKLKVTQMNFRFSQARAIFSYSFTPEKRFTEEGSMYNYSELRNAVTSSLCARKVPD